MQPAPVTALALALLATAVAGGLGQGSTGGDALLPQGLHFYAGDLHAHTSWSDGTGTPAEAFAVARANGLDFMVLTEHSEAFDAPTNELACAAADPRRCLAGEPVPGTKWRLEAEQAADASEPGSFLAMRGFELTMDEQGHLNVFGSAGYLDRFETGDMLMQPFWTWLTDPAVPQVVAPDGHATSGVDGLGQFNHPDSNKNRIPGQDSWRWEEFHYVAAADARMVSLEVFNHRNADHAKWYPVALDKGWHVAPTGVSDTHGADWGDPKWGATLVVAPALTEAGLLHALEARHVAATVDRGLRIVLATGDHLMGDRFEAPAGSLLALEARVTGAPADLSLELVTHGGDVVAAGAPDAGGVWRVAVEVPADGRGEAYYYVQARDAAGPVAFTAPLWVTPT